MMQITIRATSGQGKEQPSILLDVHEGQHGYRFPIKKCIEYCDEDQQSAAATAMFLLINGEELNHVFNVLAPHFDYIHISTSEQEQKE